jgi:hypothetical protein
MSILVGSKSERTSRSGTGTSVSETKRRHSNSSHSKFKLMKLRYKQVSCAYYASNRKNIPRVLRITTDNLYNHANNTTLPLSAAERYITDNKLHNKHMNTGYRVKAILSRSTHWARSIKDDRKPFTLPVY